MTAAEFRLMERDRSWELPELTVPPVEQTQERIAHRWEETAAERREVIAEIDRRADEWVALLQELVRIPSVNPSAEGERALASAVATQMSDLGMTVRQMEPQPTRVSNYATLTGTHSRPSLSENLLYYGHLDTVPVGLESNWKYPPFSATVADGRMWGRGTKDCKLGIAAALASTRVLRDLGIELVGDLMITTPADEETGGHLGIARMIDAGWLDGVKACVYGEGYPERLTIGARGGVQFRVVVKGKSSHTARKEQGINAILRSLRVATTIDGLTFDDFVPHDVVPGRPTASVNLISGGFKINVVPDRCEVEVDLRFPPGYSDSRALAAVESALEGLRSEDGLADLVYEIEAMSVMRPYAVDPAQPVAQALARCVAESTGKQPTMVGMPASSDARWIYLDGRVPVVNFSHGNESGHQPNEYVDLAAIVGNVKSYALMTLLMLG
jgi:acetylornithine deacetylase/succinyl-diaminopimelate desuccinylase family protein